jgi:hypothetical protein
VPTQIITRSSRSSQARPAQEAPGRQPGGQQLRHPGLDHRRATGADHLDLGRIDVDPIDVMSIVQQAGRRGRPDIAEPHDRNMQNLSSPFQGVATLDEHACGSSKFPLSIKQAVCYAHRTPYGNRKLPPCQRTVTADISLTH